MFYDYEKKINQELAELRSKHKDELDQSKANLKDIYERQISFLKDTKEELEMKLEKTNMQLNDKKKDYDELLEENRALQRRVNSDLSELRIQLKIKTDELERLQTIQEETSSNLKQARMENDMLKDKNTVLKGEYYRLEAKLREEGASMKAELAVAKEKLLNYESIEKEIDDAVLNAGKSGSIENNLYLQTLQQAPTTSKRRIQ
mmetsp:Transcript_13111/g.11190  ORF Transcript_13111/g.11190 Transcript_13111/m.11190 type:complete len:204 (+) Transcript_13111:1177-1788(+)